MKLVVTVAPLLSLIALLTAAIPEGIAPKFTDITTSSGIQFVHRGSPTPKKYLLETMGSGVALFDFDNDGLLDIFFVNGAKLNDPEPPGAIPAKDGPAYWNRLYHQKKDGTFEDVTERAGLAGIGYGMGVAVADFDNDGFEDLYVTAYGGNKLYRNNGDGTFSDVTQEAGVAGSGWSTSAAWVDYDNDGRLDLLVLRYLKWDFEDIWCGEHGAGYRSYCHPDLFKPETMLLFHNEDGRHFREVSREAGLTMAAKGLGVAIGDYDRDGKIDIFVANDSMQEFLLHNKGNGKFEEAGLFSQVAVDADGATYAGMGADFADYNNDGWPDIAVTTLANQRYALYTNSRDGSFEYATYATGLAAMSIFHSGWGLRFFDFDNDGWKDLFVAQGHVLDTIQLGNPALRYKEPPLLARNVEGKFVDVSKGAGTPFDQPWAARGLAIGDLNNDGRMDVVITTTNGPPHILRNDTASANHWMMVQLAGTRGNRDGIGAVIKLTAGGRAQYQTVSTAGSYCSSSDRRAHFGLGAETKADIEVTWPAGTVQKLTAVKADRVVRIEER